MPITTPSFPALLTRTNWDKNKGILAKIAGFTGMGEALATLETQYKKVDWPSYDMQNVFSAGNSKFTLSSLKSAIENAVADVKSGECGKLRLQAFKVRDLADKTQKDFKNNKLIPKSSGELCGSISKAADQLGVAANPNSMGSEIIATGKLVTQMFDGTAALIEKNYASHLSKLESAIVKLVKDLTYEAWKGAEIMTLARNLNQQIGNVENLANRGYDVGMDPSACTALFKDMRIYASVSVPFEPTASETVRKDHLKTLLTLLKRAKALK